MSSKQLGFAFLSFIISTMLAVRSTFAFNGVPTRRSLPRSNFFLKLNRFRLPSRLMCTTKHPIPVTLISNKDQAEHALRVLNSHPDVLWSCDTEVAGIDVKKQGPVGNGKVICASIYGGEHIDFGSGSALWIDNAGQSGELLQMFKKWFENNEFKKVWHNYGFDRHVMANEGIHCKGFAGDTMHMARLWDTSRDKSTGGGDGYSLASLTELFFESDSRFIKTKMKELFGVAALKRDGSESKIKKLPDLLELQNNDRFRADWIDYSARDAVATYWVREKLQENLMNMPWVVDGKNMGNLYDFYIKYVLDFGELLTDMEAAGIKVDTEKHLRDAEKRAREERQRMEQIFMDWAAKQCPDGRLINSASTAQVQQLLFGHYENGQRIAAERTFKLEKSEEEIVETSKKATLSNPYALLTTFQLKDKCTSLKLKVSGSKSELMARLIFNDENVAVFQSKSVEELIELCVSSGLDISGPKDELVKALAAHEANKKKKADLILPERGLDKSEMKKTKEITVSTIGLEPIEFTPSGIPQVSAAVLKRLAGKDIFGPTPKWGDAMNAFKDQAAGVEACRALGALAAVGQIDATINNFLVPLQALVDKNSRIHCSLNLNTETGRLSSRRPNLQNQPALEKDQYKIRDAFVAEEGCTLIVADYGQLELRILAHITNCKSMIAAFAGGGCFHSRTAVGMYDYIKEAVDSGKVLLEWDYSKGQPTVPLVKDTYASERRKAKTLNFSIAYGKTVHGLAQDWGITKEEAQDTLDAWYRDRPEVRQWQEQTQMLARKSGFVRTIMGRYRRLPEAITYGSSAAHALRAAINTPIQGSAADVVMMAMIKLWKSDTLKKLGWKLLLQVHDEVILEGPKSSKDEALAEVISCMENPFDGEGLNRLLVHLDVDAKSADSWYKAK